MPLRVSSMMQYLTIWGNVEARSEDYAALMVVKAVKGRPPGGRPKTLTYGEQKFSFGPHNPGPAVDLWTAWAVDRIKDAIRTGPIAIVPVPNRHAVHGSNASFPTQNLATLIAADLGDRATVETELWWDQEMTPASEGGPRRAYQLFPHLVAAPSTTDAPRILLDDVFTLGGHLQACAAKLRQIGHAPELAFCCGRTCHEQLDNPFVVPVEELADYNPDDPFGFSEVFLDES